MSNNAIPAGSDRTPTVIQLEELLSVSWSGSKDSLSKIVSNYAKTLLKEINIHNTKDTLYFLRETIIQNLQSESENVKLITLRAIDRELSTAIDQSNAITTYGMKKFLPFGRASKIYKAIFYLTLIRNDNPFVNKGYAYRKSIGVWLQGLGILLLISFLDFLLASISLAHSGPAKILIWKFSAHSLAIWLSAITASAFGAWLPFGHLLGGRDSMLMEEYTLRAQVTAMLGTSIVLGTLLITIMTCLNENIFDHLLAPGARELFEIGICGVFGAGDTFVWNILRKIFRFITP